MSISMYDGGSSTVLILPLLAMHEEYRSRARQYNIGCWTWTRDCDIATAPQLLLVAVEDCPWPDLQAHINTLIRLGRLARIVVDEVHLLVKHELFRTCMANLSFLGLLAISIVLMTATCPRDLEKVLFEKIGRKVYRVIRRSTDRPEISQEMVRIEGDPDVFEHVVAKNIISATRPLKDAERALLFCNSRDECDRMVELLGWKPYHSSIAVEERSESMKLWKDGAIFGLACTSMLNCCLDYPSVRYVFHLGPPRDVIDYYQAIGRASRDGGVGKSIVYFDPMSLPRQIGNSGDLFGKQVIYDMLHDRSCCRRLRPSFFLDGAGVPCAMMPRAQLCDICAAQSNCELADPALYLIPNDLIPPSIQPDTHGASNGNGASRQPPSLPDPVHQPAPSAPFSAHLAAANASLASMKAGPTPTEEVGQLIRITCNRLARSCINCWCNGLEYHSHDLERCRWSPGWKEWASTLRLPVGYCFYCGCPQKV